MKRFVSTCQLSLLLLLLLGLAAPTLADEEKTDQESSQPAAEKEGKKTAKKSATKTFSATFVVGADGKLVKIVEGKPMKALEGLPAELMLKLQPLIEEVSPEVQKGAKVKTSGKVIIIDENGKKTVKPFKFENASKGMTYEVQLPEGVAIPKGVKKHISNIFLSPVELVEESRRPHVARVKVISVGPDGKQTYIDFPGESEEFKTMMATLPEAVRAQIKGVVKPAQPTVPSPQATNSLEKKLDAILNRLTELEKKVSELE